MSTKLKTAVDFVPEYAEKLDATFGVVAGAKTLADQFHGADPHYTPIQQQPSTIAVACLHVAAQMRDKADTLETVCEQTGKSKAPLHSAISHIADELAAAEPMDGETA